MKQNMIRVFVLTLAVFGVNIVSCDLVTDQSDGEPNTMIVTVHDSTYQLAEADGMSYMGERSYQGTIAGKILLIETYQSNWKNDTCSLTYYEIGSNTHSYARYGNDYNIPNFGKIIRSTSSGRRETGTFYFDIVSGNDTLHFRDGKYDIYIKPGK